ncbi:MAG: cobyrinate a,c-diamide synthase [Thermoplasmata archaeon]
MVVKLIGVSAPYTGSGKTTVTLALASHLRNSAVFKIGPDFIDTGLARSITGYAENIDRFIENVNYKKLLCEASQKYEYGIFEGVMGLHDSGLEFDNSTYFYFKKLGIPHIIVMDVSKLAENAYYIFKGLKNSLTLGVIINNYHGEKHLKIVEKEFEKHNVKIFGRIPFDKNLYIEERHLGLKTFLENPELKTKINMIQKYLNYDFVELLPEFKCQYKENFSNLNLNIGIAMDAAFNFYYQYNLNLLSTLGNVNFFSPLADDHLEDFDFIYIGGGYPEIYKENLEKSERTREFLIEHVQNNRVLYGECGGLMYLMDYLTDGKKNYKMVGIFKGKVLEKSGLTLGYTELLAEKDYFVFKKGDIIKGHEFHYSNIESEGPFSLKVKMGKGIGGNEGLYKNNAFASYTHLHFFPYKLKIYKYFKDIKKKF